MSLPAMQSLPPVGVPVSAKLELTAPEHKLLSPPPSLRVNILFFLSNRWSTNKHTFLNLVFCFIII